MRSYPASVTMIALLLLGAPTIAVQLDGRDPGSIPKFAVPEPPKWEDVEHPEFEPYPVESGELQDGAFFEQFSKAENEIWESWKVSTEKRKGKEPYDAKWAIEEPTVFKGFDHDNGLVLKDAQKPAAIARKLDTPISTQNKPLVIQYEVKAQQPLRCGGAYVKILPTTDQADWSHFSDETPYAIMFGPDRCGETDKVHFILRRNGKEHHLTKPPRPRLNLLSTLYTLVIYPDQRFEIRLDGNIVRYGSLLNSEEFDPPLALPREIEDPNDTKPKDWVDDEYIPDPDQAEKPEDWDETEPYLISDPGAVKPAAWREDISLFVADPDAKKPEGWDDEEDGEWSAPEILNPLCMNVDEDSGEGCGPWEAPLIRNPKHRGQWTQPLILNPAYEGEWSPRLIANPDFDANDRPSDLETEIGGLGFELWTVQSDILFDNIYLGQSLRDAENIGNATWSPKFYIESAGQTRANEAYRKQAADSMPQRTIGETYRREFAEFKLDPIGYSADMYNGFIDLFRRHRKEAITTYPVTTIVATAVACLITALVFGILNTFSLIVSGRQVPVIEGPKPSASVEVTDVDVAASIAEDEVVKSSATDKVTDNGDSEVRDVDVRPRKAQS